MDDSNVRMFFNINGFGSYGDTNRFAEESQTFLYQLLKSLFEDSKGQLKKLAKDVGAFTVADFGTADGHGFMKTLPAILDFVQSQGNPHKQIMVVVNDGPENDFKSVTRKFADQVSTVDKYSDVFLTTCGKSFYNQCLPDNTLSLGCSTAALHFLSEVPCLIEECSAKLISEERQLPFKQQAAKDWETFLLHRARELKSGGCLALMIAGRDSENRQAGCTRPDTASIYKLLGDNWKKFCTEGIITENELLQSTFPIYMRTRKELNDPFVTDDSPVLKSGLKLISIGSTIVKSPYYDEYLQRIEHSDAQKENVNYAVAFVNSIRSWSYFLLYYGLSQTRSEPEKQKIMTAYYEKLTDIVAREPASYILDYVYNYVLVTKE